MEIIQILVVLLLYMSLPSSSPRNLQQQTPASEFPPPLPHDLPSPQPPPSPRCTLMLPPEIGYLHCSRPRTITFLWVGPPFRLHPAPAPVPEFPPTIPPSPVGPLPQPHQPKYLLGPPPPAQCPWMSPEAETTYLYYSPPPPVTFPPPESSFPLHPVPAPEFPPPLPDDLPPTPVSPPPQPHQPKYLLSPPPTPRCPPMSPKTTYLYYSPPPPMKFLPPEFPFPLQPPPAPELSSPSPFSYILRWLSGVVGTALFALLVVGCRTFLIRCWAAPNHPVPAPNQGVQVQMQGGHLEMQAVQVEV